MNIPIVAGRFICPAGAWKPNGPLQWVQIANAQEKWRRAFGARLFVGLHVNQKPKWTQRDVIDVVKHHWIGGASILKQRGLWLPRARHLEEEPSVQILLVDDATEHKSRKAWARRVIDLAEALRAELKQETIVYEIQDNGITYEAGQIIQKAKKRK